MKTTVFLLATFLLGGYGIFFSSCTEKASNNSVELSLKELYKDSVYLEIVGNLDEPEVIWGNVKTYLPAFYRMTKHSRIQNNQVVFDCQSAEELKISPNIYEFVIESFRQTNQQAMENGWEIVKEYNEYGVVYKFNRFPQSRNTNAGTAILKKGAHLKNFMILEEIVSGMYRFLVNMIQERIYHR
ncbi:MAG: hypothetical protein K2L23_01650 [Odoribacter sp.]|nr:hypothetical protein [Odoribacter sp.]